MKAIFLILGIILSMFVIPAQAQTTSEFGYQLHPEKLLENTEGKLQVFVTSNEMMVPKQVKNMKAVSSDNDVIQIIGIGEGNDEYTKNILFKANEPGITSISIAAPGFLSQEITLEVFNNNNHPTQILMKVTPNSFPVDGPRYGHVTLELATTGGIPTLATEDITIHLDTPNNDVIKLKNSKVIISSGEYYAITEFEIIGSGDAIIFAETEGMKKISRLVNVLEAKTPLKLQLYTYPNTYTSYSGTRGYAIIQLLDGEGVPVLAEEDIHFKLSVENPDVSINTSHDFEEINFDKKELVIEKGSYSTFTKFSPRLNLSDMTEEFEQTFRMFISVENYLTSESSITVIHDQIGSLEGKGPSVTKTLPFLTTGKQEIIAVTYYETEIEVSRHSGGSGQLKRELVSVIVPVQAKNNHSITFSSSELNTVNPINPMMKKTDNAIIVFGETGTLMSEDPVIFSITDNEGVKTVTGLPVGPNEDEISIIVEPLVPMILAEAEFPVLAYLSDGEEITVTEEGVEGTTTTEEIEEEDEDPRLGVTPFVDDAVLTFSANEFVETDYVTIKRNQPYALIDMMSNKLGTTTLSYQMSGYGGTAEIISHTTDPAKIHLSFQKNILANSNTLASVQLLDSSDNPVYAKKDTIIKLVSNDDQVIKIPQNVIIKEGDYFKMFELEAIDEGEIELALLSEDFELTKYDINVIDITPVLSLDLGNTQSWNERIEAKLSIAIPEIETSLDGYQVEWITDGGEVRSIEEVTNSEGVAILNIIANDKETVSITANVTGGGLSSATISKSVKILNMPIIEVVEAVEPSPELPLDMTTMILIIIPVSLVGMLFFLKRTDRLDLITEKIPFGDKLDFGERFEEIKEKVSDIRNR